MDRRHIILTSHPAAGGKPVLPIRWGAASAAERGPVIATTTDRAGRNAIGPVWYLPGVAHRFGIGETALRRGLFEHCGGMFPELVTRPDLKVFLPPIGGTTVYLVGDPAAIRDPSREVACRVHDECNGSD